MASDYYIPKRDLYGSPAVQKPAHHSLFGNLLRDVVDLPKGMVEGLALTAQHPIRSLKLMGAQSAHFYSPLVHGDFGKFYGNVHSHPLQPILDAISVATLAAGGIGIGVKAASAAVEIGRTAELLSAAGETGALTGMGKSGTYWAKLVEKNTGKAPTQAAMDIEAAGGRTPIGMERHPGLARFARRFQKNTEFSQKALPELQEGYPVYKNYSHNIFTRAMQKGWEGVFTGASKVPHSPLGKGGIYDFTAEARAKRLMAQEESRRVAATTTTVRKQQHALKKIHRAASKQVRRGAMTSEEFSKHMDDAVGQLVNASDELINTTGIKIDSAVAKDINPHEFPFVYRKDVTRVERPKGPMYIVPKHLKATHGNSKLITGNSVSTIKTSMIKAGPGRKAIRLPDSALESIRHEGTGKLHIAPPKTYDTEGIKDFTDRLAARYGADTQITLKASEAARDADGQLTMIRTKTINHLESLVTDEAKRTAQTMKTIGHSPIVAWKYLVLSLSPRYFVNNLTNYLMYAMSANPIATTRGMLDAIQDTRGLRARRVAEKSMEDIIDNEIAKYTGGWYQQFYAGIHSTSYGSDIESGNFKRGVGIGFEAVEKGIYQPSMKAGTMAALRSIPKVRSLERFYRDSGMSPSEAFNAAATRASADRAVHSIVMKSVGDWAGQYYHLNGLEKKLTAIVPFYNWDRHALRFARSLALDHPTTTAMLTREGALGNEYNEKNLGNLPDFMKGVMEVPRAPGILGKAEDLLLGAQQAGRKKVMLTAGINPLQAATETVHAVAALGGAYGGMQAVSTQFSPVITGVYEGLTGTNMVTGAKVDRPGGIAGSLFHSLVTATAPVKLAEAGGHKLIYGDWGTPQPKPNKRTGATKPFLYQKGPAQNLRSWLGINVRDFDQAAASALYNEEHHITKGRSDTSKFTLPKLRDFNKGVHKTSANTGFRKKRKYTVRKTSARSSPKFPPLRSNRKGLKGIGGLGGI